MGKSIGERARQGGKRLPSSSVHRRRSLWWTIGERWASCSWVSSCLSSCLPTGWFAPGKLLHLLAPRNCSRIAEVSIEGAGVAFRQTPHVCVLVFVHVWHDAWLFGGCCS